MDSVAVIIPHYNDVARLERCLMALMPQLNAGDEVIVVDNGSSQSLDPIRHAFPTVPIVIEAIKGAAPARNRGVRETKAPILAFLDADCIPADHWLAEARAAGEVQPLTGGAVDVFDESPSPRTGAQAFEAVFAFHNKDYVEKKGFSVTANLVTRRSVFEHVGPFRTGVSEDLDWCHRARASGARIAYSDSLRVSHPTRSDWPELKRKWKRLTDEAFGVNGAGAGARIIWALKALAMPSSAIVHLPKVLRAQALTGPEKLRAAGVLLRLRGARMIWMLRQSFIGR